jgi:chemotaxis protein MotA
MRTANGPSQDLIIEIISFAEKARREGILVLEDEVDKLEDPFEAKGLKMMVDGVDPELLRNIMEKDIEQFEERKKYEASVFDAAGGFSPTFGIIGTVMGLVLVLGSLGGSAADLGHSIGAAFIATLYGIAFANVFWLPIGLKLKKKLKEEVLRLEMILEGIMAIQAGENPSLIKERLSAYLEPADLKELQESSKNSE